MKLPNEIQALLQKRFAGKQREWLREDAGQNWPLVIQLGAPSEAQASRQFDAVRAWVEAWRAWRGEGELEWVDRRWRVLGSHALPANLRLEGPQAVCAWIGEADRWQLARQRHRDLAQRWPQCAPAAARMFDLLADSDDADFGRLMAVLEWVTANPASGLFLRQLPVPGMDSKWIESRKGVLARLLAGIRGSTVPTEDLYAIGGLRPLPANVRMLVLDPVLRKGLHGLRDVSVPLEQLADMNLTPATVLVVENLQTGLALPDLPGAVAFVALGYRVDVLSRIPWIGHCRALYWGDIDTHGYAILHRARQHLPQLRSLMMDEATLLRFRPLWGNEASQSTVEDLPGLFPHELAVYQGLLQHRWGHRVRLEQERISWPVALQIVLDAAIDA